MDQRVPSDVEFALNPKEKWIRHLHIFEPEAAILVLPESRWKRDMRAHALRHLELYI